jgi:hypothetical protein
MGFDQREVRTENDELRGVIMSVIFAFLQEKRVVTVSFSTNISVLSIPMALKAMLDR